MKLAIFLSTFTSIGLIVLSTGELEYWVTPNCIDDSRLRAESLMGPDLTCFDSWGYVHHHPARSAPAVSRLTRVLPRCCIVCSAGAWLLRLDWGLGGCRAGRQG